MSLRAEVKAMNGLLQATFTLMSKKQGSVRPEVWDQVNINAGIVIANPSNAEWYLVPDLFRTILKKRKISFAIKPYWNPNLRYIPLEVFSTAIQWSDNIGPVPQTTVPPEADVNTYAQWVLSETGNRRLRVPEQFDKLLDITGSLAGAANLGMLAHRHFARGSDNKIFPNIKITPDLIREWNNHIAQFEGPDNIDKSDGPGDTYYFYTQMFAALIFNQSQELMNIIVKKAFQHGVSLMQLATHIAGEGTVTKHTTAASLGWNIGLALSELAKEKEFNMRQ